MACHRALPITICRIEVVSLVFEPMEATTKERRSDSSKLNEDAVISRLLISSGLLQLITLKISDNEVQDTEKGLRMMTNYGNIS